MPQYSLTLYAGPMSQASTQCVELEQDGDALDLVQIALLSTTDFTHAEVYRGDALVGAIRRDSLGGVRRGGRHDSRH